MIHLTYVYVKLKTLLRVGRGQRDSRGRSLEFMMRLESRFRLSEEKHETCIRSTSNLTSSHRSSPAATRRSFKKIYIYVPLNEV